MRLTITAIVIVGVALVSGLLLQQPERAAADYNITGPWTFFVEGEPPCTADIVETKEGSLSDVIIEITFHCDPPSNICGDGCIASGALNQTNGYFELRAHPLPSMMSGTITNGGHAIAGNFLSYCYQPCIPPPGFQSHVPYSASGGNGDPKLGTPTPAPTDSPPPPVAGVSFDTPSSDGSTFDASLLTATACAFFLLGCAALYAWRRG